MESTEGNPIALASSSCLRPISRSAFPVDCPRVEAALLDVLNNSTNDRPTSTSWGSLSSSLAVPAHRDRTPWAGILLSLWEVVRLDLVDLGLTCLISW